jgi:hypothetical protein
MLKIIISMHLANKTAAFHWRRARGERDHPCELKLRIQLEVIG